MNTQLNSSKHIWPNTQWQHSLANCRKYQFRSEWINPMQIVIPMEWNFRLYWQCRQILCFHLRITLDCWYWDGAHRPFSSNSSGVTPLKEMFFCFPNNLVKSIFEFPQRERRHRARSGGNGRFSMRFIEIMHSKHLYWWLLHSKCIIKSVQRAVGCITTFCIRKSSCNRNDTMKKKEAYKRFALKSLWIDGKQKKNQQPTQIYHVPHARWLPTIPHIRSQFRFICLFGVDALHTRNNWVAQCIAFEMKSGI